MKRISGTPGTWSGMALRGSQCLYAAASCFFIPPYYAFNLGERTMYAALGLLFLWSFILFCRDIFSLRNEKDLHSPDSLFCIVVIDWVLAAILFAGACASASLLIFFMHDVGFCTEYPLMGCNQAVLSVTLGFITWFLLAVCCFCDLWLLVTFF